jgi:hypothetical protein
MMVTEPIPGTSLQEKDETSSMTVTWEVSPRGAGSRVTVTNQWNGAGGIGGFFERRFAPSGLKKVLDKALAGLDQSVTQSSPSR